MGKKSKKTKDTKKKPVSQKFSVSDKVDNILSVRWIPVLIFIMLSIFYFRAEIFEPVVIFSSEGSVVGYGETGGSFKDFSNPFKETGVWRHPLMGGHPAAQALVDYTSRIFLHIAVMFFKDYRATALWVVVLMFLAGLFMFYYMRAMGLKKGSALLIGTAYMFAPMFLSFTMAMHYSKMGVMALLPLIFLNIEKGMREGKFRYFLYLGGCIALAICTAHLQYAYYMLLASGLYFVFKLAVGLKDKEQMKFLLMKVAFYCFAVIIGFGLSARCFMPQYFHTSQHSKRAFTVEDGKKQDGVGIEYSASWSLHPEEIASYLLPEFGHFKEYYWGRNLFKINTEYFGSIILLLSLMSLIFVKRDKIIFYFWGIFVVGILFSLGLHTPVFKICYYVIPGMKRLRGPSMSAFLVYFSAMVLAGISLKYLFSDDKENGNKYKYAYMILGSAGLLSVLLFLFPQGIVSVWKGILYSDISQQKAAALERNIPQISKGALILLINILVLFAGIFLYQTKRVSGTIAALLIIPMIIIDTYRIDREFVKTYPIEQVKGKSSPKYAAYEFIKEQDRSPYRVFPDHAVSQSGNPFIKFPYKGLNMVTGFLDFTLWRYDNYLRRHNYLRLNLVSENSLSLLGTKYIVSLRDFSAGQFELVYNNNRERVYRNKKSLPFYYVRKSWVVEKDEGTVLKLIDTNAVDLYNTAIIEKEPPKEFLNSEIKNDVTNIIFEEEDKFYTEWLSEFHFKIKGESPGLFVVSDNFHPGWRCYIDGKETEIYHANYLWKGVFFPAGEHEIHFKFISKNIVVSRMLMFSFMGLFFALFLFVCYKDYGLINRIKVLVKK